MKDKVKMWFAFLLKFQPVKFQHEYCMEFEEGYAEAFEALMALAED